MLDGLQLFSRNGKDLNRQFPRLLPELTRGIPLSAVVDGELCALDEQGRPCFNLLQNYGGITPPHLVFYTFDLLAIDGESLLQFSLRKRRQRLAQTLIEGPHLQLSGDCDSLEAMLAFVRGNGLEGVVAKKLTSIYEPGERTGAWQKMRLNLGQEFVIGGFTHGVEPFDSVLIGFYRSPNPSTQPAKLPSIRRQIAASPAPELIFCASVRNGFVTASRRALFKRLEPLLTDACPFANLPETSSGRFGQGLTAKKMKDCTWVWPRTVAHFDFVQWTPSDHLRHASFIGVRDDKHPFNVVKET